MNPYFTADDLLKPSMGINWSYISQIDTSDLMLKSNRSTLKIILQDFLNTTNFDGVPGHLAAHLFIILQIIIRTMIKNHKKRDQKLTYQIEKNEFLKMQVQQLKSKIRNISLSKSQKVEKSQSMDLHKLPTPQYHDLTEDTTRKLLAAADEDRKLKETIHDVEKELLYQQKSNELKIKHYFQKKMLKLNNKIDQMSNQIKNDFSDTFSYTSDVFTISENDSKAKDVNDSQTKESINQNTVLNDIPKTNINNDANVGNNNTTKDIFYISSTYSD